MAGASLLTLIDNIATLLEDISVLSKVAVSKTAGVLGDDLALNAQQVHGLDADRELPVVWAVAKGSLVNKAILCPTALAVNYVAPWGVTPLLVIGGIYLCFEGVEKICHKFLHGKEEEKHQDDLVVALCDEKVDMVAFEKERIQGAVRTDFVLSAEIIVITLGLVAKEPFWNQVAVMIAISLIMTVGVYGLVGGIVKLDDLGLAMSKGTGESFFSRLKRRIGGMLVQAAPKLLRLLSIVGTIAMFTVGGGIIVHGIEWLGEPLHHFAEHAGEWTHLGWAMEFLVSTLSNISVGLLFGAAALAVVEGAKRMMGTKH
jgi:predicted DNA repair protein MutK